MDIERKEFPFVMEEKGLDPEARTFKGFAAVMGNLDDGGDIIERGAFKKTIAEMGHRVKVYWIHDFSQPIGKVLELSEVSKSKLPGALLARAPAATGGLYVKGYLSQTPRGEEALTLMRDAVLDELSIGFKSMKEDFEDDGPEGQTARHLQELKLVDISPVPLAMNVGAIITDVKQWNGLEPWDDEKPYPNEHACRLEDPGKYDTCRRGSRVAKEPESVNGKKYAVIYCKKGDGPMEQQAFRYSTESWTAEEARSHCKFNEGSFEAAKKAEEPPSGALPADQIRSRERRLRLAKHYIEEINDENTTGEIP